MTPSPAEIHKAYAALCIAAKPVTGKTIIESKTYPNYSPLIVLTALLTTFILSSEITRLLILETPSPHDVFPTLYWIDRYFVIPISPFLWAMMGSCVFLLKKHSDLASDYQFDRHRSKNGWGSRVILGTVLGGMAPLIFDMDAITDKGIEGNVVAFLIGLSVKVFYGVLEKSINELAERFNLTNLKAKTEHTPAKTFVADIAESVISGKVTPDEAKELLELLKKMKDK